MDVSRVTGCQATKQNEDFPAGMTRHVPKFNLQKNELYQIYMY